MIIKYATSGKIIKVMFLGPYIEGKVSAKYLIKVGKENLKAADFGF